MTKIKVCEATDLALDWLVAKCQGLLEPMHGEPQPRVVLYVDKWQKYLRLNPPPQVYYSDRYQPTTDWAQGGPIIEREKIATDYDHDTWNAAKYGLPWCVSGPTALIAAMCCFVASKLGDEVEIPEELL